MSEQVRDYDDMAEELESLSFGGCDRYADGCRCYWCARARDRRSAFIGTRHLKDAERLVKAARRDRGEQALIRRAREKLRKAGMDDRASLASQPQCQSIHKLAESVGIKQHNKDTTIYRWLSNYLGRPIKSTKELTVSEANRVQQALREMEEDWEGDSDGHQHA